MGIRGLSTFVDLNHQLLSEHKLHDTRVIIDGNNLYHFLWNHYKVTQQFGGDYDHFSRKCKLFFNILHKCHVTPFVVFDGGYDPNDRKLSTILDRMKNRILSVKLMCNTGRGNVMPILAQETFRQALVELGIQHVSCQYEADREIAVLANMWQCPVMSNDSDFFVFGLDGGFMPFDYVNLTLCVCDSKTEKASVLDMGAKLEESQFVYIPVKLYKYDRFVKQYGENLRQHILPVFATVLGNDYIDPKLLEGFYAQLHVPKKNNQRFSVPKLNTRMLSVLKWLSSVRNVEKSIQSILIHLPRDKRDDIREKLVSSIEGYSNLSEFSDLNLKDFFETHDDSPVESVFPKLEDFFGDALPPWFVAGSRKCEISGHLQNIAVLHRTICLCQVEILAEPSTYWCSRDIIKVICGVIFGQNTPEQTEAASGHSYLVEYDRDQLNIKKVGVEPVYSLPGLFPLPNLHTLPTHTKEDRFKLLTACLGLPDDFIGQKPEMQPFSVLLVSLLCYWIKHSQPKVTQHHVYSLLVGIITLHVRCLKWLDQKVALGASPVIPYLSAEIKTAYQNSSQKQIDKFLSLVDKFFPNPNHSSKNPRENQVVHGFSQFQACLFETIHLNQVLALPTEPLSPSVILNSTFVYNLCRDLQRRVNPDLFLAEILVNKSPLHELFLGWKNAIFEICEDSFFEPRQWSVQSQRKSRPKSKKVKTKSAEKGRDIKQTEEDIEEEDQLVVNCDVSNKFAMLGLED